MTLIINLFSKKPNFACHKVVFIYSGDIAIIKTKRMITNLTKDEQTFQKLISGNPLNINALARLGKKFGVTIKANRSKPGLNRVCLTDRLLAIYDATKVAKVQVPATLQTVNDDTAKKVAEFIKLDKVPKKKVGNQNVQIVIDITLQELANLLKSA